MRAVIDSRGRVTVATRIRDFLERRDGGIVAIRERWGVIDVEPAGTR